VDTEDVPFRLQGPAQMGRPIGQPAGDEDGLDIRIRQDLFDIADGLYGEPPARERFGCRGLARVRGQLMAARSDQSVGHIQAVGVVSQECEAHATVNQQP
jgi:hypothetical protein